MAENRFARMKELASRIRDADTAYYRDDAPTLTDREYDALVEELQQLERETGIILSDSPTRRVSGANAAGLSKVRHTRPMRSAQKTKSAAEFLRFARRNRVMLSRKLDGLTLVLRYSEGTLRQALTRGEEGLVGEDVTHTVRYLRNVPLLVPCKDDFEVRGEGLVSWKDFRFLSRADPRSQPRSLAAGAVRSYAADRGTLGHLEFFAFELILPGDTRASKQEHLDFLAAQGFAVVEHLLLQEEFTEEGWDQALDALKAEGCAYPVDGIIAEYDDLAFGRSLGATEHHENRMMALKWADEAVKTVFRRLDCGVSATGQITFTAEFDPVVVEGSLIKRADLHALSNLEKLALRPEDEITVYKANMIIPQIAENLTRSGSCSLPTRCPCCGTPLARRKLRQSGEALFCENESCLARNVQKLARFCGEMGMEGFSAAVVEKLAGAGLLNGYSDLFCLRSKAERVLSVPGFGPGLLGKLVQSAAEASHCRLSDLLRALGVPGLGKRQTDALEDYFHGSWDRFEKAVVSGFDFSSIEGISAAQTGNLYRWYRDPAEAEQRRRLLQELRFRRGNRDSLAGAVAAITGIVNDMSKSDLRELLTVLGVTVIEEPSESADFLIVGRNPDVKLLSQAIRNQVEIITESHLTRLLSEMEPK